MFTGIVERKVVSDTIMGGIGVIRVAQMYKRLNFCLSHSSRLPSITSVFGSGCIVGAYYFSLVITMVSPSSINGPRLPVRNVPGAYKSKPKGSLIPRRIKGIRAIPPVPPHVFKDRGDVDSRSSVSREDIRPDARPHLLPEGSKETTTLLDEQESAEGCNDAPGTFFESGILLLTVRTK